MKVRNRETQQTIEGETWDWDFHNDPDRALVIHLVPYSVTFSKQEIEKIAQYAQVIRQTV